MPYDTKALQRHARDLQRVASGTFVTEHENDSDAAIHLQNRDGYLVHNRAEMADGQAAMLRRLSASGEVLDRPTIERALVIEGRRVVSFHLRYQGGTKPPIRKGGPRRKIRAGGWADRRGVTANSNHLFVEGRRIDTSDLTPRGVDNR